MPRSKSSLLNVNLRHFLSTESSPVSPLGRLHDSSTNSRACGHSASTAISEELPQDLLDVLPQSQAWSVQPLTSAGSIGPPGTVWIDCYFYGFWIEEKRAEVYRSGMGCGDPMATALATPVV
jgi:hypothetical protein|tara:strand:+ start:3163 stop:3528 length:366 start_codon:yes stop_codon:yes gene_type:complete